MKEAFRGILTGHITFIGAFQRLYAEDLATIERKPPIWGLKEMWWMLSRQMWWMMSRHVADDEQICPQFCSFVIIDKPNFPASIAGEYVYNLALVIKIIDYKKIID